MGTELQGKRIAFLATDGVEQVELTEPWRAAFCTKLVEEFGEGVHAEQREATREAVR